MKRAGRHWRKNGGAPKGSSGHKLVGSRRQSVPKVGTGVSETRKTFIARAMRVFLLRGGPRSKPLCCVPSVKPTSKSRKGRASKSTIAHAVEASGWIAANLIRSSSVWPRRRRKSDLEKTGTMTTIAAVPEPTKIGSEMTTPNVARASSPNCSTSTSRPFASKP